MSPTEIGIIGTVLLMVLLMAGAPVGFSLFFIGFGGFALVGGLSGAISSLFIIPLQL
jgi:hypothetical protein